MIVNVNALFQSLASCEGAKACRYGCSWRRAVPVLFS